MSDRFIHYRKDPQPPTAGYPESTFPSAKTKGKETMTNTLIFFGIFALWFALQMWILPKFGVST